MRASCRQEGSPNMSGKIFVLSDDNKLTKANPKDDMKYGARKMP